LGFVCHMALRLINDSNILAYIPYLSNILEFGIMKA
jgi:hypothetical protein